jgi:hypothetical protein
MSFEAIRWLMLIADGSLVGYLDLPAIILACRCLWFSVSGRLKGTSDGRLKRGHF